MMEKLFCFEVPEADLDGFTTTLVLGTLEAMRSGLYKEIAYPGPDEFEPRALGAALATYLRQTPQLALASDDPIVRALALLDRRLSEAEFLSLDAPRHADPLWQAFHRLRASRLPGAALPGL